MKSILYISTNRIRGGSEELWTRSAKSLSHKGYFIAYATRYEHPDLNKLDIPYVNFADNNGLMSILKRGIKRFTNFKFPQNNVLRKFIQQANPQLIIISQGDTYQALDVMQCCSDLRIPYLTITQLVGDVFIWTYANNNLPLMQQVYTGAQKNYFVSHHNLQMHNAMLGIDLPNAEVVYNPCKISDSEIPEFPEPDKKYNIGLVGRIDCWHKGYDFLLQIAGKEKWIERPVQFNLYGDGPYLEYMKGIIASRKLSNIVFKGNSNHVSHVWKENQILFMPSRMEGQALALIEAARCQRAAVVTNVGGAAELIEEGYSGFIAEVPAVDAIDAALERAWEQRSQWKVMGLNAAKALQLKYPADAVEYFNQKIIHELESIESLASLFFEKNKPLKRV